MKILKNVLILFFVLAPSFFLGSVLGKVYAFFIPTRDFSVASIPSEITQNIIGWPLSYIFFLTLLFTAFGGAKKYWWIGIGLIPAVLFEVAFDLRHLYFPIAIGLVAWLVGRGVALLLQKKM